MAVKYGYLDTDHLTNIGNALNTKLGATNEYVLSGVAQAILSIQTGVGTEDATATSDDILTGKTAYVNGVKVTGAIEKRAGSNETLNPGENIGFEYGYYEGDIFVSASLATEESHIDSSIKAEGTAQTIQPGETATINGGKFYTSNNTVTAAKAGTTGQISEDLFEEKTVDALIDGPLTVNPSDGKVLTAVTVNAPSTEATATDTDILSGKTAYVNGQLITGVLPAGGDALTEDATALASEILAGKTAYIQGGKVIGTMNVLNYYIGSELPSASEGNVNDLYILTN